MGPKTEAGRLNKSLMWGDAAELSAIVRMIWCERLASSDQEAVSLITRWWCSEMEGNFDGVREDGCESILRDLEPKTITAALTKYSASRVAVAIRAADRRDVAKRDAAKRLFNAAWMHVAAHGERSETNVLSDAVAHYRAVMDRK